MSADIDIEMQIMQENLCDLRKIAGWTAETLANKMGVTKQTVSNIETQKVKISRIQYIAIRAIFECEVVLSPSNTTLKKVLGFLFKTTPNNYAEHREKIRTALLSISSIAVAGLSEMQLYSSAVALLAPLGRLAHVDMYKTEEPSLTWLIESLKTSSFKNDKENMN